MGKKILLVAIVFVITSLCSSAALALAPVGPPTAGLKTGQWSTGFDYLRSELNFDIDWSSDYVSNIPKSKAKNMKSDAYLAKLSYGVSDNWELYGFLGVADSRGKVEGDDINGSFDGGYNFSGGFGTKWTFSKGEKLSWGLVYQMSWWSGSESSTADLTAFGGGTAEKVNTDLKSFDIFLALGPTYKMQNWQIYGGLALYYYNADINLDAMSTTIAKGSADKALFGGYIGTLIDISENCSLYGEYMLASDASALGTGIVWKF